MAEPSQYVFGYKELAGILVKQQGLHEGFWSIYVRFGINAANVSLNNAAHVPTAIVPVLEVGIQRDLERGPLSVDAAEVNPAPTKRSKSASVPIPLTAGKTRRKPSQ